MYYIQSGDEETRGSWLAGFIRSMPVWTDKMEGAKKYDSQNDTASDEALLEKHHHLCWIIPA
jgi:hypothetical protein